MPKHRQFTAEFKANVALAALRDNRPTRDIIAEFEVHPTQITEWKNHLQLHAKDIFARDNGSGTAKTAEVKISHLYEQIGRLQEELAWTKKNIRR